MSALAAIVLLTLEAYVLERLVAPLRATLSGAAEEARVNLEGVERSAL